MNCKQGDLAVQIKSKRGNIGALYRIVGVGNYPGDWTVELLSHATNSMGERKNPGTIGFVEDEYLRPIRDPGDDAQDETLQWLDVPSKETV